MKAICKEYYKYSRDETILESIRNGIGSIWTERAIVARNTNLPCVLERLSSDPDLDVRCYTAENNMTPIHSLLKLSKEKHGWIQDRLKQNPSWILFQKQIKEMI